MTQHGSEPAVSQTLNYCGLEALQLSSHPSVAVIELNTASLMFTCTAEDRKVRGETYKHGCTQMCPMCVDVLLCVNVHIQPHADS